MTTIQFSKLFQAISTAKLPLLIKAVTNIEISMLPDDVTT